MNVIKIGILGSGDFSRKLADGHIEVGDIANVT
jgi:hypothetical protein